jgi:hypothetical protein
VRTVRVVVAGELDQHLAQMPLAEDQQVIQALAPQRAHKPLGKSIRTRRLNRRPDYPRAVPGEDLIKGRGELAVPVTDQELEPPGPLTQIHEQVPGLLRGSLPYRMRGDAQDVHGPGLDLQHDQHVQALQQHRVHVQEITRQDA